MHAAASNPTTWPRAADGSLIWGEPAAAVTATPPVQKRYEPLIVTVLRRYIRRGASPSLLHRIAGGAAHFKAMNSFWDLDGRTVEAVAALLPPEFRDTRRRREALSVLLVPLSSAERRIALLQTMADCMAAGESLPTTPQLAAWLCTSEGTIQDDIDWLRAEGRITAPRTLHRKSGDYRHVKVLPVTPEASP